jgi:hypothetical protein
MYQLGKALYHQLINSFYHSLNEFTHSIIHSITQSLIERIHSLEKNTVFALLIGLKTPFNFVKDKKTIQNNL